MDGWTKVLEYQELVDREVDLTFNLTSKYLPVIYGIQKVSTFPIFADAVLNDNRSTVYVAHAISEGEIGGIFDVYVEGETLVCFDEYDSGTRDSSTSNTSTRCYGRADKGYVLSGNEFISESLTKQFLQIPRLDAYDERRNEGKNDFALEYNLDVSSLTPSPAGITHERLSLIPYEEGSTFKLIAHTGKAYQRADATLVGQAQTGNFIIQSNYYPESSTYYWNASHTLLDTAYVTSIYTIKEGETTIPNFDFVVRGKLLDCYNYDYSYETTNQQTDHVNFYQEIR